MNELLLGIDVGTQTTKGVLCTPEGVIVAVASVTHSVEMPRAGWYEQNAETVWWGDFCEVTHRILSQSDIDVEDIVAVACSSMTPNTLLLDCHGIPVRTAILYCDSRAIEVYPRILDRISDEEIFNLSGFPLTVHGGWQGGQLLWMQQHEPEVFRNASKVVGTTNYLVYKLTGNFVADLALARCAVPFFNQNTQTWSEEVCAWFDIPSHLFPERIGHSTEIAGEITRSAAAECGLRKGTAVTLGAMDTNADMVAAGVTKPGDVGLAYGSALIGTKCLSEPCRSSAGLSNDYVVPNRYLCGSGVQTGGALIRWFRDAFGFQETEAQCQGGSNAFTALSKLAETVPAGSDSLILVPLFGGAKTLLNTRLASGTVLGLSMFHSRAHLYRAMLEGTAYEMRRQLEQIAPEVVIGCISSVGGGTMNRIWTQIVSDVLDAEQHCHPGTLGAPYGNAYLAGLSVGIFANFEPLRNVWLRPEYVVTPNFETRTVYEDMYEAYLDAIEMLDLRDAH